MEDDNDDDDGDNDEEIEMDKDNTLEIGNKEMDEDHTFDHSLDEDMGLHGFNEHEFIEFSE